MWTDYKTRNILLSCIMLYFKSWNLMIYTTDINFNVYILRTDECSATLLESSLDETVGHIALNTNKAGEINSSLHSWYFIRLQFFKRSEVKWEGMRIFQAHYLSVWNSDRHLTKSVVLRSVRAMHLEAVVSPRHSFFNMVKRAHFNECSLGNLQTKRKAKPLYLVTPLGFINR